MAERFLNPAALWWLAALLPAITLLYFLKLRRAERVVSSTLLWRRSTYDLRVNAPFRWIRRNLLLLLQLLAAALLVAAYARPFTRLERGRGRQAVLVLDASGSMTTRDETGRTRFEAAKEEARRLIEGLGASGPDGGGRDELALVLAADRPTLLAGLTSDKGRLLAALEGARARATGTDMAAALELALSVTGVVRAVRALEEAGPIADGERPPEGAEVYVGLDEATPRTQASVLLLSDGAFPPVPSRIAERLRPPPAEGDDAAEGGSRFYRFGAEATDNRAVVAADLRASLAPGAPRQLFVRLANLAPRRVETALRLEREGAFLDRIAVSLPPADPQSGAAGQTGAVFELPPGTTGALLVRLEGEDAMPVDDAASLVLHPPEPIRTLLVTEENFFLRRALASDPTVRLELLSHAAARAEAPLRMADGSAPELVVFDRVAMPPPPAGGALYVDAVPDLPGLEEAEPPVLYAPVVLDWNRGHPLLRHLTLLDRLRILSCRHLALGGGWSSLMEGEGLELAGAEALEDAEALREAPARAAPLLAVHVGEARRVAVLAFDIYKTERWPMRVSFPLFVRNAAHWLGRPGGLLRAAAHRTGATLRARFETGEETATVLRPSGTEEEVPLVEGRLYYSRTDAPGLYRVRAGGEERLFALSLLDLRESRNAAREAVRFGEALVRADEAPRRRNVELWPWVALAVLGLLLGEWYVFNRRVLG